jgi:hypothetical protein
MEWLLGNSDETVQVTTTGSNTDFEERERVRIARIEEYRRGIRVRASILSDDEALLVADLRMAGFDVRSAWDLFNRKEVWNKDEIIPDYSSAMPILVRHLDLPYHFRNKEGIVRALTHKAGRFAFDRLVGELRLTPTVAEEEKADAIKIEYEDPSISYTKEQIEYYINNNWNSYCFALANAVGYLSQRPQLPIILDLIQDQSLGDIPRRTLVESVRQKQRRGRRKDPDVIRVFIAISHEIGLAGQEARKSLEIFGEQ